MAKCTNARVATDATGDVADLDGLARQIVEATTSRIGSLQSVPDPQRSRGASPRVAPDLSGAPRRAPGRGRRHARAERRSTSSAMR